MQLKNYFRKSKQTRKCVFLLKNCIPEVLASGAVYKFHCWLCNESCYGECVRYPNVRTGERTRTSLLVKKES